MTGCIIGAFHVVIVQETEMHHHEIAKEPRGAHFCEEVPGTSKHDSFGLSYLVVNLSA